MPRKPSILRALMAAQDHADLHLPDHVLDGPRRAAVAARRQQIAALKDEQRQNIESAASKIAKLREHMTGQTRGAEFAAFRFAGTRGYPLSAYSQDGVEGGIYSKPEDDREAFIDRKMEIEGLA